MEKSCLLYSPFFRPANDISVACCGSNISAQQVHLLIEAGAKEIVVALDRQFKELGDDEHKRLVKNFRKLQEKYKNYVRLSFIFDKNKITSYKASPILLGHLLISSFPVLELLQVTAWTLLGPRTNP